MVMKLRRQESQAGTLLGSHVREILLDKDSINMGTRTELLLFEADRAQHVDEFINPALLAKK